jgi:iron uptake system EfeUOB component EfeO/EfeM
VYDLLRPVAAKPEPEIVASIDKDFAALDKMIAARRAEGAEALADPAKAELGKAATALAADLSRLRETMDLSQ